MNRNKKGFTLIELLVVIAIVAVLAVVVILTLNPAELLRQARDSNRVSDAATMKSAMALYLADVATPYIGTNMLGDTANQTVVCFNSASTTASNTAGCGGVFSVTAFATASSGRPASTTLIRNINGTGWVPVDFTAISSKSPISNLPVDPTNLSGNYYAYAASGTASIAPTYKFVVKAMESSKYQFNGGSDAVSTDGGTATSSLEVGTNLNL